METKVILINLFLKFHLFDIKMLHIIGNLYGIINYYHIMITK